MAYTQPVPPGALANEAMLLRQRLDTAAAQPFYLLIALVLEVVQAIQEFISHEGIQNSEFRIQNSDY